MILFFFKKKHDIFQKPHFENWKKKRSNLRIMKRSTQRNWNISIQLVPFSPQSRVVFFEFASIIVNRKAT